MARPPARTIISSQRGDEELDILESEGYWCIAYQGDPIGLRQRIWTPRGEIMKYPRTGFNNKAHCERLAAKLNAEFETEDFTCLTLIEYDYLRN